MERARQGSLLDVKPSDLEADGRPWAALIAYLLMVHCYRKNTGVLCKNMKCRFSLLCSCEEIIC